MSRRPLLTVLAVAAIGLAACGTTDAGDVAAPAPTLDTTTEPATEETAPATEETAPAIEDEGPGTDVVPTTPPAEQQPPAAVEDEGPGTDTPPAPAADPDADGAVQPVTLAFDGREVPVAQACTGVDGAILATTEGEVTITLVREEGTVLRYQAEGTTAETDEVAVEGGTDATTYRATLSSPEVAPVAVGMVVMDDAMAALSSC